MKKQILETLENESQEIRNIFLKCTHINWDIPAKDVQPFISTVVWMSSLHKAMAQGVFSKLHQKNSTYSQLHEEKRALLKMHIEEMVFEERPSAKGVKPTYHFDQLLNLQAQIGYGRDSSIYEEQESSPCFLEWQYIGTMFKTAEKKPKILFSLMQVIQYLEPYLMDALESIVKNVVHLKTGQHAFVANEIPEYILGHRSKDYHEKPILLEFYSEELEIPELVNNYCRAHLKVITMAFERVHVLMKKTLHENGVH